MKNILLARPSQLLIKGMKRLVSDAFYTPKPLSDKDQLNIFHEEVAGIVVSNSLSSQVKEDYRSVIKFMLSTYPGLPIFVASFTDMKRTKLIVNSQLKDAAMPMELLTLEEASERNQIDYTQSLTIITRYDFEDNDSYPMTLYRFKKLLSHQSKAYEYTAF